MALAVRTSRPEPNEYPEYHRRYVRFVPEGDVVLTLSTQIGPTLELIRSVSEARADEPYGPGKWNLKQVVGHLSDWERVFTYRALTLARRSASTLPDIDPEPLVANGGFESRTLDDLSSELESLREATVRMFAGLPDAAWLLGGVAAGAQVSVRALAFMIAGHERHHLHILQRVY